MGRLYIGVGLLILVLIFGGIIWFNRLIAALSMAIILVTASVLFHRYLVAPACDADDVTFAVTDELSSKFPDGGLNIKNIHMVRGSLFSSHRECEMEVASTTGLDVGVTSKWTKVSYSTSRSMSDNNLNVDAHIVGPVATNSASKQSN